MVKLLEITGTILSTCSIIAGFIFIRKGTDTVHYLAGAVLIVQGLIIGVIFFFFSRLMINLEKQTRILEEIRDSLNKRSQISLTEVKQKKIPAEDEVLK